ncbi:Arc/MetJ-type ribon-helix-helix transcriptional regulator [Rhizobium sp. PP-WC-2G-219]|nr:Arc/MetJ-type ribon-helix-helix transcriptional regulator [Rhizobium sp. PP-WC-2G-219]
MFIGSTTVNLPDDIVALVEAKVASGEYLNESDVVRDSLLTLAAQNDASDRWLGDDVVPTFNEGKANPEKSVSLDEAFDGFRWHVRETATRIKA